MGLSKIQRDAQDAQVRAQMAAIRTYRAAFKAAQAVHVFDTDLIEAFVADLSADGAHVRVTITYPRPARTTKPKRAAAKGARR